MIVRANLIVAEKAAGAERMLFSGTLEQVKEDLDACQGIGAEEVFFDPTFSPGAQNLETWMRLMEQVRKLV
jgi:hypothetical protein